MILQHHGKSTNVDLSVVVLPGLGFNLLLGLTWIVNPRVILDSKRLVLVYYQQEHPLETMSVPEPSKGYKDSYLCPEVLLGASNGICLAKACALQTREPWWPGSIGDI